MIMSYKSGKKRTKLERIIRQDHSDVYFDNERLNDELSSRIEGMQRDMLRHDIQRAIEIHKLKKEIHEFKLCRAESRAAEAKTPDPTVRPQTVAGHSKRRKKANQTKRSQSAWAFSPPNPTINEEDEEEDEDEDEDDDDELPKKSVAKADQEVKIRVPSAASDVSTLRNTRTLRRYKNIGANCFKENNRFPEEWYHRCLPASDAAIYNARKKSRGKSAGSHFNFLQKIRDREEIEKRFLLFSSNNRLAKENGGNGANNQDMNIICEEPVKPILLSRRRLKELADAKKTVDRAPSRNTVRKQHVDEFCFIERRRMEMKVREFCHEIEALKKRQIEELKEREEQRRREIQEQIYLRSIELSKLEKSEDHEKSSYEEAEDQFDKFHIIT